MIKASKTHKMAKSGLPQSTVDDQDMKRKLGVNALYSPPMKPPMYVSLSMTNSHAPPLAGKPLTFLIQVDATFTPLSIGAAEGGSDSEALTDPSNHSEPHSDNEGPASPVYPATSPPPVPMRAEVQRLIDVMPDAVNSADAAQEARALLRSVQADLEANWRLLDELIPQELFHQLQQCCIVENHPIKRMALITLTYIADLMPVSDDAYRLMASLFPEQKGLPEMMYKCESFFDEPNAPFEERFAYALFFNMMCREAPEEFVLRQRLTGLLCHCVRRMELQHQAVQAKTYCCPTLVPELLKKLEQLVGVDAVWKAKEDPTAYWRYLYAYTTHDPSTRLLVAKVCALCGCSCCCVVNMLIVVWWYPFLFCWPCAHMRNTVYGAGRAGAAGHQGCAGRRGAAAGQAGRAAGRARCGYAAPRAVRAAAGAVQPAARQSTGAAGVRPGLDAWRACRQGRRGRRNGGRPLSSFELSPSSLFALGCFCVQPCI